jgi:fructose-specific phosphotransferase system IIC component
LKSRPAFVAAIVAGVAAILTITFPNRLGMLVAIVLGIVAGMVMEEWNSRF